MVVAIPVQSVQEEAQLRAAALVKGVAVDLQVLDALLCVAQRLEHQVALIVSQGIGLGVRELWLVRVLDAKSALGHRGLSLPT